MRNSKINYIAKIAVLGALSFIVMFFEIPLPFAPAFYKIDFSEVIILIGSFALGPVAGCLIEALKLLLHIVFKGTTTAYVGELANFIIGASFFLPAAILYKKSKSKKSALSGLIVGTISMVVIGCFINYYLLLPAYSYFYHMPIETIIEMGTKINPAIVNKLTLVLLATLPFNLVKGILDSIITILLYKRVSPILHKN